MDEHEKEQNKMLRGVMVQFVAFVAVVLTIYIGLSLTFDKTLEDVIFEKITETVEQTDTLDTSEEIETE